jgi:hypothetical protein
LRRDNFKELGLLHRKLFLNSLAGLGIEEAQLEKVALTLGPVRFDSATDRSVLASMNVARSDLDGSLVRVVNVMYLNLTEVAKDLNHRPAKVAGVWIWPDKAMMEKIALL